MLVSGLSALSYALVSLKREPSAALIAGGAGLVVLALFVIKSLRAEAPALDLSLFRSRSFSVVNAASFAFSVAFTAMFFGNVLFLTKQWELSTLEAGLWLSPGPLSVIPVAIFAGRRADRIRYRILLVVGSGLFAIGGIALFWIERHAPSFALFAADSVVLGAAIGIIIPSLTGAVTLELRPRFICGGRRRESGDPAVWVRRGCCARPSFCWRPEAGTRFDRVPCAHRCGRMLDRARGCVASEARVAQRPTRGLVHLVVDVLFPPASFLGLTLERESFWRAPPARLRRCRRIYFARIWLSFGSRLVCLGARLVTGGAQDRQSCARFFAHGSNGEKASG